MRLIACLIEVTVHYGAVYRILYEHREGGELLLGTQRELSGPPRRRGSTLRVGKAGGRKGSGCGSAPAPRAASSSSAAFPGHPPPNPSSIPEK